MSISQGENADDYEFFRRAIAEDDEEAWNYIHAKYAEQVEIWVQRCGGTGKSTAPLVEAAFARFQKSVTRLETFPTIVSLLHQLQFCAAYVVVDAARIASKTHATSFVTPKAITPDTLDNETHKPPKLLECLLHRCAGRNIDDLLGDFEEQYNDVYARAGERNAWHWYRAQVLHSCRSFIVERFTRWSRARVAR